MNMQNKKKFLYRWVILLVSFILMAVPFSLVNTIHTLFIRPVTEEQGFTISAFSLIFTLSAIVIALISPLIGKLLHIISIRWIMSGGAFLVGSGFIAYSFAGSIQAFYAIGIVVAVGMAALTTIPVSTMITNWFKETRGTALGIAFAGAGTGTFFWMQIVSRVIDQYAYHYAYLLMGIIILTVALPITLFFVNKSPEEKYKLAFISGMEPAAGAPQKKANLKKIMGNAAFWPFSIGLMFMGTAIAGVQIHLQSYLTSLGYSYAYNANVGSTLAISALASSILGGIIFDKFSTKAALNFFGSGAAIALLLLLIAQQPWVPYLFAVLFGGCLCLPSLWPSYGVGRIFTDEDYASTLGIASLFFVAGGAVGPFFSGLMADSGFGYKSAWLVYFVLTVCYLILFRKSLRGS